MSASFELSLSSENLSPDLDRSRDRSSMISMSLAVRPLGVDVSGLGGSRAKLGDPFCGEELPLGDEPLMLF